MTTTFQITLTDEERRKFAELASFLSGKLMNASPFIDSPPQPAVSPGANPAAASTSQPGTEVRDRWAKDRKGNEVVGPEGSWGTPVTILKTEKKSSYLRVSWQAPSSGYVNANCFDRDLWAHIETAKAAGAITTVYLLKSSDGKYLNLVGIRA
jgi:hypothetical protein